MSASRREFLLSAGAAAGAGLAASCGGRPANGEERAVPVISGGSGRWHDVRQQFRLSDDLVHMNALLISSHPAPVRERIDQYREEIDASPVLTLQRHNRPRQAAAREAAGRYLGVPAHEIALTDSTTMGIGLIYNGLRLRPGQELLTTEQDYFVTHEALRQAAARTGASVRRLNLYDDSRGDGARALTIDRIVETLRREIQPHTRVLALTWVHSSTGLELPLREIGRMAADVNRGRDDHDRTLVVVDGVHGFGVEPIDLSDTGIDAFAAGCHKWLFGPRGTGIAWATRDAWAAMEPSIPSFIDDGTWEVWLDGNGDDPGSATTAARMSPGGFKAFEHQWALPAAFEFHESIGRQAVAERTHALARQLKEGLEAMDHVRLVTPLDEAVSAGIVSFDVDGMNPRTAVQRLLDRGLVATVTPYAVQHVRLTPSIRNLPEEVEHALDAVRALA